MTQIKICGIKSRDVFERLCELEVEYAGFVFAPSKRQVSSGLVREITAGLPVRPRLVGVFVNENRAEMIRIAQEAELDVLQLHGDESAEECRELRDAGHVVWKAWGVTCDERDLALPSYVGAVDAVLLDNERGGTGERFPWEEIPALQDLLPGVPLFVAGGLSPSNVGDLAAAYVPYGVDVSSGVEINGAKDPALITAFVTKVRNSR